MNAYKSGAAVEVVATSVADHATEGHGVQRAIASTLTTHELNHEHGGKVSLLDGLCVYHVGSVGHRTVSTRTLKQFVDGIGGNRSPVGAPLTYEIRIRASSYTPFDLRAVALRRAGKREHRLIGEPTCNPITEESRIPNIVLIVTRAGRDIPLERERKRRDEVGHHRAVVCRRYEYRGCRRGVDSGSVQWSLRRLR